MNDVLCIVSCDPIINSVLMTPFAYFIHVVNLIIIDVIISKMIMQRREDKDETTTPNFINTYFGMLYSEQALKRERGNRWSSGMGHIDQCLRFVV